MNITRRKFFKLAGTASLSAIFGLSLTGCAETKEANNQNYEAITDNKKYFDTKTHHYYIEVSTETNGQQFYYEENISQTSNFIPVKGGHAGARSAGRSSSRPSTKNNNSSTKNYHSYYGNSNYNIINDYTRGAICGALIVGSTQLLFGNTEASGKEDIAVDIPEGYEMTNVEELKNEDYIYGYKIHFENTVPIETHAFKNENGEISYPYPGEMVDVKSQGAVYVKTKKEITI